MNTTTNKITLNEIRRAFDALDGVLINGWTDERKTFFELCESEEKEHGGKLNNCFLPRTSLPVSSL